MQKGMTHKILKKRFVRFWLWIQKRIDPKNYGSIGEQSLLESVKSYAKLNEFKFNLQWVRLRLHLLNVQCDPWKINITVGREIMSTSKFTKCLNSSQPWNREKNCSLDLIPKVVNKPDFLSFPSRKRLRENKKPKFNIGDKVRIYK